MTPAIEIRNLEKFVRVGFFSRHIDVLFGISLQVKRGSVFGFVGPNGAGKSTTIKTLIGASRPSGGSVAVLGGSPREPELRRRIGFLPEFPQLPPTLTPRELLTVHATLAGVEPARIGGRCASLLERVGLAGREDNRVATFSKGMQQRVGIALSLIGEPELLILDEPMSGLDPLGRRLVRDIIQESAHEGRTVFFSSHVLPDVESLCDDIALLHRGRIVANGSLQSVLGDEAPEYEILFRAPEGEVPPAAEGLGGISVRGDRHALRTASGDDAFATATRLRALNCTVESVEPLRASLEDRLVELIQSAPDGGES